MRVKPRVEHLIKQGNLYLVGDIKNEYYIAGWAGALEFIADCRLKDMQDEDILKKIWIETEPGYSKVRENGKDFIPLAEKLYKKKKGQASQEGEKAQSKDVDPSQENKT